MTRKSGKAGPAARMPAAGNGGSNGVRVRMYDVGFGDCFLLFIPTPGGPRKVLIDCGSIKAHATSMDQIVGQIIADVTDSEGKARIDVVVATHRHRDHISGFADRRWNEVEVKEVWMPWIEKPNDPDARRIRQAQGRLAQALHTAFLRMNADRDLVDLAFNATANDDAMERLHRGFDGAPLRRFLPESPPDDRFLRTDALPGVFIQVLGPSHDDDVIRDMDPPAGQSYLRLVGDGADGVGVPEPFDEDWVEDRPFPRLDPDEEDAVQNVGNGREEALAAQLDKAVNGTSLMLLFQIGEAHLLFPGDAQWGTWKAALDDPEVRNLLDKVTFYKVGHHGSHNATPTDFVKNHLQKESFPRDDLRAMVSVTPFQRWPDIPRVPLLDDLRRCTERLARSDEVHQPQGFERKPGLWVETTVPM